MAISSSAALLPRPAFTRAETHSARATTAAHNDGTPQRTVLKKGALLSVSRPMAHTVECLRGLVWITHDNEPDDIILAPGQSHHVHSEARLLLQALDRSEVRIRRPQKPRFWPSLAEVLRGLSALRW